MAVTYPQGHLQLLVASLSCLLAGAPLVAQLLDLVADFCIEDTNVAEGPAPCKHTQLIALLLQTEPPRNTEMLGCCEAATSRHCIVATRPSPPEQMHRTKSFAEH